LYVYLLLICCTAGEEQAFEEKILVVGQISNSVANTSIRTESSSSYVLFSLFTLPQVDISVIICLHAQSSSTIWSVLLH
jgi:hypothetical protein